jgi:hypothetical protein
VVVKQKRKLNKKKKKKVCSERENQVRCSKTVLHFTTAIKHKHVNVVYSYIYSINKDSVCPLLWTPIFRYNALVVDCKNRTTVGGGGQSFWMLKQAEHKIDTVFKGANRKFVLLTAYFTKKLSQWLALKPVVQLQLSVSHQGLLHVIGAVLVWCQFKFPLFGHSFHSLSTN